MTQGDARDLKLWILAEGLTVTPRARQVILAATRDSGLSAADYASTSGVILKLEPDVWVNAPIEDFNPNFVDRTATVLDVTSDGLSVRRADVEVRAWYCLQPAFHAQKTMSSQLVVTHGDRARLSPLHSCAMTCTFCNIPYDAPLRDYRLEPIDACVEALRQAVSDPVQPARHILISGGTPKPKDISNHQELYRRVLTEFPDIDVDIMMVPLPGLLDLDDLARLGVNELSINLEVFDARRQQEVARQKFNWGRDYYLDFIEDATRKLGPGRVRSMFMVGLEPIESTLDGVRAVARAGGVPVLSPFRPDPATPLRGIRPPSHRDMETVYFAAAEIVAEEATVLGPSCPPCTHNTLSFGGGPDGEPPYRHPHPAMLEL